MKCGWERVGVNTSSASRGASEDGIPFWNMRIVKFSTRAKMTGN